jgi:CO/xanthine dehydrogenase FAD-binding subunit
MPKTQTPETLADLAKVLARHRDRVLLVPDSEGSERPAARQVRVDIGKVRGLAGITRKGRTLQIGTGSTLGEVLRRIQGENGLLMQAVSMMANPLVRNRVTVLAALDPESHYFDLATALVSLRARVRVQSQTSSRVMAIGDFLLAAAEGLKPGEYPSSVEFAFLDEDRHAGFFRVNPGRGKPTVSASVLTRLRRNVALDPEIAVSSSTLIPVFVPRASRALLRQSLSDANVKNAAGIAAVEMMELEGSEEDDPYERSLIEVAVSRALRRLLEMPAAVRA